MLYEVDSFATPLAEICKNTISKNKKKKFIIPFSYKNWKRMKRFAVKEKVLSEKSNYWGNRIKEFVYFWDYKKELLLITGFFNQLINYNDNMVLYNFTFTH